MMAALLSAAFLTPVHPLPVALRGEWQAAQTQCGTEQEDTLNISSDVLRFYEARFEPKRWQTIKGNTLLITGRWQEDGRSTAAALRLSMSADKTRMTVKSPWWTSHLVRCS
jgi:hypothetical protein